MSDLDTKALRTKAQQVISLEKDGWLPSAKTMLSLVRGMPALLDRIKALERRWSKLQQFVDREVSNAKGEGTYLAGKWTAASLIAEYIRAQEARDGE
jgi:hypothetical protein